MYLSILILIAHYFGEICILVPFHSYSPRIIVLILLDRWSAHETKKIVR
jgi:hypothetical protein